MESMSTLDSSHASDGAARPGGASDATRSPDGAATVDARVAASTPVDPAASAAAAPAPTAPLAIQLRGVVKRYGAVTAVAGLDLDVPTGTCVGLLGPNGAGKSTTMKMLTAQAIADEGTLEVLGFALPGESKQARAQCGVVPQLDNLDVSLTVEQNLTVFAHLYRIPRGERQAAVERAMQIAKLTDRAGAKADELSGGMRRRLLIARALVHQPRLVMMDEPTVGLDPQVRQELWALIDALRAGGTTILMSTHYIEDAERLCDTVVIVSHGRAVASGHPTSSRARTPERRPSRCTAPRPASPRSSATPTPPASRRAAPAPRSRSSAPRAAPICRTASGALPLSKMRSSS